MTLNYKKDVAIDPEQLDVEWLGQAELGRKYARNAAKARMQVKFIKDELEVFEAELTRKVAEDPVRTTGEQNPAKHHINAYIITRKEYKALRRKLIKAEYQADYADMVQREVSMNRKDALKNMVSLFIAQYFAGPSVPRDLVEMWNKRNRRTESDDLVEKALNKRKNKKGKA